VNTDLDFKEYQLKHIANGGFSFLYSAVPKHPEKPHLTLKILRQSVLRKHAQLDRFKEEALILKGVQHSSLPELTDSGSIGNLPYLAYKHIRGQSVLTLLQKNIGAGHSRPQIAVNIMTQLLNSLDYLHCLSEPIIHNDVSPENLIINQQAKLFLIDFGCAHVLKAGHKGITKWIGKPSYLSPEQAQGLGWDHRSDLYQAGIIFYELLARRKKNPGATKRLAKTIAANPPPLDATDIPASLNDFIAKLLHIDPEQRWQSAGECIVELGKISTNNNFSHNQELN
jgi:serine/threonine-protein kinase